MIVCVCECVSGSEEVVEVLYIMPDNNAFIYPVFILLSYLLSFIIIIINSN